MSAHIEGPWTITNECVGGRLIEAGGLVIGFAIQRDPHPVHGGAISREQCEANARLMAAAPAMLAVLQELAQSAQYWSEYEVPIGIVMRMDDAIALATGGAK